MQATGYITKLNCRSQQKADSNWAKLIHFRQKLMNYMWHSVASLVVHDSTFHFIVLVSLTAAILCVCMCSTYRLLILQEFIRNNPMQAQPLMQAILQNPSLTSLLAPNFNPNSSPPDIFVSMYSDLVQVPSVQGMEVAFTLLSKVCVCCVIPSL